MAVKSHIQELADKISSNIHFDKETNIIKEDNAFEKHLPDGLDMPTVEKVGQYNADFVAASALAVGTMAINEMQKHKSLDVVSSEMKMAGKDVVSQVVTRQKSFTNPTNPSEPVVKHGDINTVYSCYAGKNQGQLKACRAFLHEIAEESLNGKK